MFSSVHDRALRVGIVWQGKLVTEQAFTRRTTITFGTADDCTLQVAPAVAPGLPRRVTLLRAVDGQFHAVLPADGETSLQLRGQAQPQFVASPAHLGEQLVPVESCRGGSLTTGDLVVMFQFVRPDAVPLAMVRKPRLRVGLVHADRLLTEQVFELGCTVTVGVGAHHTFALPESDYDGPELRLGPGKGDRTTVRAPLDCQPRLAHGETVLDCQAALQLGVIVETGSALQFELVPGGRGRCRLGPYTVLFQVVLQSIAVASLIKQPLRQRVVQAMVRDPIWKASLSLSALLLGSVVAQAEVWHQSYGRFTPVVAEETAAADWQPEQERLHIIPVAELEPAPAPTAQLDPIEPPKPVKPAPKSKVATQPAPKSTVSPMDARTVRTDVQHRLDPAGRVQRDTIAGTFRTKMYQFDETGGSQVAAAERFNDRDPATGAQPGAQTVRLQRSAESAVAKPTIAKPAAFTDRTTDATADAAKPKQEATVVVVTGPPQGPDEANKPAVSRALRGKAGAIQRCYDTELRSNPSAEGKVTVLFSVGTEGSVTEARATNAGPGLSACIEAVFTSIRGLPMLSQAAQFSQTYLFSKAK